MNESQDALGIACNVDMNTLLPTDHKCPQFEGTMKAVLTQRAQDVGGRLSQFTILEVKDKKYGMFRDPDPETMTINMYDGSSLHLNITSEQFKAATDWTLLSNHTVEPVLKSETAGHYILLAVLAEKQLSIKFPDPTTQFQYPLVANHFPDAPPASSSNNKAQETTAINSSASGAKSGLTAEQLESLGAQPALRNGQS